ncbi:MAG: ferrochelatase [Planctomycetaceae bacterium]|nr:ferrochelatase [Planctomycetaceae bacterium]
MTDAAYDAVLFVSFGGPEGPEDVMPFLENVLRGKNVPRERMLEVADHYQHFGGISPINAQCRELITALQAELAAHHIDLPIVWGNRNWDPLLPDALQELKSRGSRRVLAYVTSAFSSYSGCRQYRENIRDAQAAVGAGDMEIHKIRAFYNHPDFISVHTELIREAIRELGHSSASAVPATPPTDFQIAFTAHSIPQSMADTSDYEKQLTESCRLVAESLDVPADGWQLVFQSRSGRPQDPWLEPDINDHLKRLHTDGVRHVVISPIGFLSDHIEVLYDLDDEARTTATDLGLTMVRAGTPGSHPTFVSMLRKLIQERLSGAVRECVGRYGPNHDTCPVDCCPAPVRPHRPA